MPDDGIDPPVRIANPYTPWLKGTVAVLGLAITMGCSHELVLAPHTGWTLRYAHHTGTGDTVLSRGRRPDVIAALLDGRARFFVVGGPSARLDPATPTATLCQGDRCAPTTPAEALAVLTDTTGLTVPPGASESDIAVMYLNDRLEVANVHTDGARFTGAVQHPGGAYVFTVEVRWIVQPGDPTAAVATTYFVAPLRRLGAHRLVAAIQRTVGLPLLFDVRIVNSHAAGDADEGDDVYRAISIGNAPPGV